MVGAILGVLSKCFATRQHAEIVISVQEMEYIVDEKLST